ncbi:MAG TPA: hypothetical protein VKZ59_11145, partial [Acidobacteriota bacterium]|nr:hypothetical protein [Acidobacteriota bacterium]
MDRTSELGPEGKQTTRLRSHLGQYIKQPGVSTTLILLVLLVAAINGIALWGIVSSGREARDAVRGDLEIQTLATARSIEAYLASVGGDFIFLSRSPQLAESDRLLADSDPVVRRWSRIDLEATLLLFLSAHPEVESIAIIQDDAPLVAADRREGAPVLVPPHEWKGEVRGEDYLLGGRWPIEASNAEIRAILNSRTVLAQVAGTQAEEMVLLTEPGFSGQGIDASVAASEPLNSAVQAEILLQEWNPPIRWLLVREETRLGLLDSIARLSSRYRITLLLNASLMTLALVLGVIAFRQVQKSATLEAQARQQTEIRNLERQLLHNERLASIGRLAAGLAHEINNPL